MSKIGLADNINIALSADYSAFTTYFFYG